MVKWKQLRITFFGHHIKIVPTVSNCALLIRYDFLQGMASFLIYTTQFVKVNMSIEKGSENVYLPTNSW